MDTHRTMKPWTPIEIETMDNHGNYPKLWRIIEIIDTRRMGYLGWVSTI